MADKSERLRKLEALAGELELNAQERIERVTGQPSELQELALRDSAEYRAAKAIRELMPPSIGTPVKITQTIMGAYGNCQSACLAMMLGIPLESVPAFSQIAQDTGDEKAFAAQAEWLRERGWGMLTVVKWQSLPWPPHQGYFIAGGPSPRGHRHSVIYKDGELWHDPHPEGGGISEVQDIDFLYPLNPCSAPWSASAKVPEGWHIWRTGHAEEVYALKSPSGSTECFSKLDSKATIAFEFLKAIGVTIK